MPVKKQKSTPDVSIVAEVEAASKALAPAVKRLTKALAKLEPKNYPTGAVADMLYALRAASKQLGTLSAPFDDVLGPAVKQLEDYFINTLAVGESSGIQGMTSRVQITESAIPVVSPEDWPKVWAHIKKTGEWELLNRAINRAAVVERWEQKKQVPGVGRFIAKKVSCTRLGRGKV